MKYLLTSSIGRKLVMSLSGAFLVLFLFFHMSMNIVAIFSADAYNMIAGFLGANWYALIGTLVIVFFVFLHFAYATYLTLLNRKARGGVRYAETVTEKSVSWSSKNMFVLGLVVIIGLILHLVHFWSKMQLVEILGHHENSLGLSPTDGAGLIRYTFSQWYNVVIYLVWLAAIWLHLTHGFWSMFQSVGWNNQLWLKRTKYIANIVATIVFLCFAAVVVWFFAASLLPCMGGVC